MHCRKSPGVETSSPHSNSISSRISWVTPIKASQDPSRHVMRWLALRCGGRVRLPAGTGSGSESPFSVNLVAKPDAFATHGELYRFLLRRIDVGPLGASASANQGYAGRLGLWPERQDMPALTRLSLAVRVDGWRVLLQPGHRLLLWLGRHAGGTIRTRTRLTEPSGATAFLQELLAQRLAANSGGVSRFLKKLFDKR